MQHGMEEHFSKPCHSTVPESPVLAPQSASRLITADMVARGGYHIVGLRITP